MTAQANRVLRRLHVVAVVLCGVAIAGVVTNHTRMAVAAIIPVLFLVVISLEALRVAAAKQEKR